MFEHIFNPLYVGGYLLKNRITMAPMLVGYGHIDGTVTPQTIAHYERRARGGASMIVVEATLVNLKGRTNLSQLRIDNQIFLPGLSKLAKRIKDAGAVAVLQLQHSGRVANVDEPLSASELSIETTSGIIKPRVMGSSDINATIEDFIQASIRAKLAGFDMIELHGAFGHLLAQFLSPKTNRRDDEYGGSLENRMRFPLEVIDGIKDALGEKYPIGYQLLSDELLPDGFNINEAIVFARELEKKGIAYLTVTAGNHESCMAGDGLFAMRSPKENVVHFAQDIKKVVHIPVFACGKIPDATSIEKIISQGKADGVALGRPLLADPDFPEKVRKEQNDSIIHCIYCCGCIDQIEKNLNALCDINPEVGRELCPPPEKIDKPKKVMIIGGGPAGIMCAITASKRGHKVTLYEKKDELGGDFKYAMLPPGKKDTEKFLDYLLNQIKYSNVKINVNKEIKAEDIKQAKPDVVIMTTGAVPGNKIKDLKGNKAVLDFRKVLLEEVKPGKHTLIIGGNALGCETAEFLASNGYKVSIVTEETELACDMDLLNRAMIIQKLNEYGVNVSYNSRLTDIQDKLVHIKKKNGEITEIKYNSIICTEGYEPDFSLYMEAIKLVKDVYLLGDAYKPGGLRQAVHSGYNTAINL